jgi:hypothetical protein
MPPRFLVQPLSLIHNCFLHGLNQDPYPPPPQNPLCQLFISNTNFFVDSDCFTAAPDTTMRIKRNIRTIYLGSDNHGNVWVIKTASNRILYQTVIKNCANIMSPVSRGFYTMGTSHILTHSFTWQLQLLRSHRQLKLLSFNQPDSPYSFHPTAFRVRVSQSQSHIATDGQSVCLS